MGELLGDVAGGAAVLRLRGESMGRDLLRLPPLARFSDISPRVLHGLWQGLQEGAPIPWEAWIGHTANWLGVS